MLVLRKHTLAPAGRIRPSSWSCVMWQNRVLTPERICGSSHPVQLSVRHCVGGARRLVPYVGGFVPCNTVAELPLGVAKDEKKDHGVGFCVFLYFFFLLQT